MKILSFLLLFVTSFVQAQGVVSDVRVWHSPEKSRIVFDVSKNIDYKIHYDKVARQAVLLLRDFTSQKLIDQKIADQNLLRVHTKKQGKDLYIAFDLQEKVRVKSFVVEPNKKYGYRLIVDLVKENKPYELKHDSKKLTILIDAGHGGEDHGATGSMGVKEKAVTLGVAKKLYKLINASAHLQAKLVRAKDYYVSLKKRVKKSEQTKADLFISIHADKYKDPRVSGASVYIYSDKKSNSAMSKWLEGLEKNSDSFGGQEKRYDSDDVVSGILLDLAHKANHRHSFGLAKQVLESLKNVAHLHSRSVQSANFYVLKYSGIPAVLIETGFISNEDEELNLMSRDYQQQLSEGIYQAIISYTKSL